jgi:hypothetical protein
MPTFDDIEKMNIPSMKAEKQIHNLTWVMPISKNNTIMLLSFIFVVLFVGCGKDEDAKAAPIDNPYQAQIAENAREIDEAKKSWSATEEIDEMDEAKSFRITRYAEGSSPYNKAMIYISIEPGSISVMLPSGSSGGIDVKGDDSGVVKFDDYFISDREAVEILEILLSSRFVFVRPSSQSSGSEKFETNGLEDVLFPALKQTGHDAILLELSE